MANDSPFLTFRVECPVCKTLNEFETIRVGAYAEEGRDTDFCPTNVKWRFPRYQGYNPLVFFVATCNNCFYSREFTNSYRDWKSDNNYRTYRLKTVKPKHLEMFSASDSLVKRLGEAIDLNRHPNESAVIKLLLAIYDEQLTEHYSRLDVGRFYLRTAWVFRDFEKHENPNRLLLNGLLHEIDSDFGQTRETLDALQRQVSVLGARIRSHFDTPQLSAEFKSQMLTYRDRYDSAVNALRTQSGSMEGQLEFLGNLIAEYRTAIVGGTDESGNASFGSYPSFQEFLQQMKRSWSGIVANEREALERAVYYYKEAYVDGREIAQGNQQIQASYLIAELSRRIGDFDEAKQYFTSTIKSGQEFVYQNRQDPSRTALAKKILELAIEQGRQNLAALRPV